MTDTSVNGGRLADGKGVNAGKSILELYTAQNGMFGEGTGLGKGGIRMILWGMNHG